MEFAEKTLSLGVGRHCNADNKNSKDNLLHQKIGASNDTPCSMFERTLNSKQVYDGKIVKVYRDDVELSDGKKSFREIVKHSGGVVVLAVKAAKQLGSEVAKLDNRELSQLTDSRSALLCRQENLMSEWQSRPIDKSHSTIQPFNHSTNNSTPTLTLPPGEGSATVALNPSENSLPSYPLTFQPSILFVRQYRYPIGQPLLELPAGKLEYGEDPFEAGKRELEEETGYCANKWTDLGYVYTSPGYSDEKLYLYMAEDLEYTKCHPDDGEILEPVELSIDEALGMIKDGKIVDAKTLCAFMRAKLL